jgi:hypothetical protein
MSWAMAMIHHSELLTDVGALIDASWEPADDVRLNELACRIFEFQYNHLPLVRRLADQSGRTPGTITHWSEIPGVPSLAFKATELFVGERSDVAQVFESSGTSRAASPSRALYSQDGLALMAHSIRVNAGRFLMPDGRCTRIFVLAPPPAAAPHMIMAWGMNRLIEDYGLEGSEFLIGPKGLEPGAVFSKLSKAEKEGVPVTLIGASFGFVHLLDTMAECGQQIPCAPGSRTLDAGGFKGRSRTVTREALDQAIFDCLAIAPERNVNVLGMTELASQFYDDVMVRDTALDRAKVNAPWTRTRVLDPVSLQEVGHGEPGLLWHLDLTNIERPVSLQTDDLGVQTSHGFQVLGRAKGAEARGCSLSVEDLLA